MPMPKQLTRDAYCLAPPLKTTTIRPPRLSRDAEVRRPRAPLRPVKREVDSSEIDSVEFVIDNADEDVKLAARPVKIEQDPRQVRLGLAAISIRPPPSSACTSWEEAAAAPGPSQCARWTQALCRIPDKGLGPADPPRGRGRPKGSKSRPRIIFRLSTPPKRAGKLRAEANLAKMSPSKQV